MSMSQPQPKKYCYVKIHETRYKIQTFNLVKFNIKESMPTWLYVLAQQQLSVVSLITKNSWSLIYWYALIMLILNF